MVKDMGGVCLRYRALLARSLRQNSHRNPSNQDELLRRSFDLAKKEFPWIADFKDRSVTELEMRMVRNYNSKASLSAADTVSSIPRF
jgi:hypothetical protein